MSRLRAYSLANVSLTIASAAAFAFVALIPIYSNISAVSILRDLSTQAEAEPVAPFSYFFANDAELANWDDLTAVDQYLANDVVGELGLSSARTDARLVSRRFDTVDGDALAFNSIKRFEELAAVVDGDFPSPNGSDIEAMIGRDHPTLSTGDVVTLVDPTLSASDPQRFVTATIVGTWEPATTSAQDWIVSPSVFNDQLVVPRSTLLDTIAENRSPILATAQWNVVGDPETIVPSALGDLSRNASRAADSVADLAPTVSLTRGPGPLLADVAERRSELAETLRSFALPAGIVTAIFVVMVMTFNVQQRQTELAVLRSRGLPVRHAIAAVAGEVIVVLGAALLLGSIGAMVGAQLMVRTQSFLDLGPAPSSIPFVQSLPSSWLAGTAVVMLVLQLAMLIKPARQTIVARQTTRGRLASAGTSLASSFDLIMVAFIAALLLQRRSLPVSGLNDPWVVVIPAAAGLGVGLLVVRALPWLVDRAAQVLQSTAAVSAFLGAQRMARASSRHRTPMLLIVVATALTGFVASLSVTLEQRLLDETYLAVGADHAIVDITPGRTPARRSFSDVAGVEATTRTAELDGRFGETKVAARSIEVIALDPTSFLATTHWQAAFDDDALEQLLAPLQATPGAVLVSTELAETYDLSIGDSLRFAVAARNDSAGEVLWLDTGGVVGAITDRFPRWAGPDKDPLLVMDLTLLEAQVDRLERATTLVRAVDSTFDPEIGALSAQQRVLDAQRVPERQAVFAILNATFAITMAIALSSLIVQTMATFRERRLEVGVLRAMGLSRSSIRSLLAFDFVAIAVVGVAVGTAVGLGVSAWLIPQLAVETGAELPTTATVAWPLIGLSALSFVVVAVAIAAAVSPMLSRRKVFDALKLGEAQ